MNAAVARLQNLLVKQPYPAACLAFALLLGAVAWWLREQRGELEATRQERVRQGEAMLSLLVGGSLQRQELAIAREAARRIEENLLVESNLAENTWYFFKLEEQTRVRLPELHQLNSPAGDRSSLYKRIPYTLRVEGAYEQIAAFVRALESGPRLVNITNFGFTRRAADGSQLVLDLSIELLGRK